MQAATEALWPWLVVAGMGAVHGLNPASGWAIAAAWGLHARSRAQAWWALLPIALGHAASVALVAVAVVNGLSFDRTVVQVLVSTLLLVVVGLHLWRHKAAPRRWTSGAAGLALGSFLMSGAHGAGFMLVPALVPLCLGSGPVSETGAVGPLTMALAAVGVHMAAMLLVTGAMAAGACAGAARLRHLSRAALKVWRAAGASKRAPSFSSNLSKPMIPVRCEHAATASGLTSHPTQTTP